MRLRTAFWPLRWTVPTDWMPLTMRCAMRSLRRSIWQMRTTRSKPSFLPGPVVHSAQALISAVAAIPLTTSRKRRAFRGMVGGCLPYVFLSAWNPWSQPVMVQPLASVQPCNVRWTFAWRLKTQNMASYSPSAVLCPRPRQAGSYRVLLALAQR